MVASLFRRKGIWQAKLKLDCWNTERRFSLGTRDKRIAGEKLRIRLGEYEKEALGIIPPLSQRNATQKPLLELIDAFLADMDARQKSPATLKKYGCLLRRLRVACGWTVLPHVTASSFCEWRKESGLSPKSLNDHLSVWSRFFRWMKRQRLTVENPFDYVDQVDGRRAQQYRRALTCDEVSRLLAVSPHPRSVIYRFILETGLRRKEAASLHWGDFVFNNESDQRERHMRTEGSTEIQCEERPSKHRAMTENSGRTQFPADCSGRVRVPASISKNARTTVKPFGHDVGVELLALRGVASAAVQLAFEFIPRVRTFRKDLLNAGIPFLDEQGRRADFHALRNTHGTALFLGGADVMTVMESMRHSDPRLTTKTYFDAMQIRGPIEAAVANLPWHSSVKGLPVSFPKVKYFESISMLSE